MGNDTRVYINHENIQNKTLKSYGTTLKLRENDLMCMFDHDPDHQSD